jgi:hypothetical protein
MKTTMKVISTLFLGLLLLGPKSFAETKIGYWNVQRKGTNLFNQSEKIERLRAARAFGIGMIRLAPNKWMNGRPKNQEGDFLLGRPAFFKDINRQDLALLKKTLDQANELELKIVVTMLSLPGSRWKQHNHGTEDRRIWTEFSQQEQAISFWRQLAQALKGHPAVIGYNIRNEPSPELVEPQLKDWYSKDEYLKWYQQVKNNPADLNLFYKKVAKAIREIDLETPIILDSGFYASPWAFHVLEPVEDEKTLYSFHMYEPYSYTSRFNQGKYTYPGLAPIGESQAEKVDWNRSQIEVFLNPVIEWQKKYKVPSERIFVGEVGVFRANAGAERYLRDTISVLNAQKWHWAFYSFREDTWAGMDYELGIGKTGWNYWKAIEKGQMPGPDVYQKNSLSDFLKSEMKK